MTTYWRPGTPENVVEEARQAGVSAAFAAAVVQLVRAAVAEELAPIRERLAQLSALEDPFTVGPDGDASGVSPAVEDSAAAAPGDSVGPAAQPPAAEGGEPGPTSTPDPGPGSPEYVQICSLCRRERTLDDAYDYHPAQAITGRPLGWYSGDDGEVCPECMAKLLRGGAA